MTSLDQLAKTVNYVGRTRRPIDWPRVEASLSLRFPQSYRDFLEYFPPGTFGKSLRFFQPDLDRQDFDLRETLTRFGSSFGVFGDMAAFPFDFYPEVGGLIPWGLWRFTRALCWLPVGEPDSWPIVALNDDLEYVRHRQPVSSCLLDLINGRGDWSVMPPDFWDDNFAFDKGIWK